MTLQQKTDEKISEEIVKKIQNVSDDYAIEFAEWCLDNNQIIQNDGKELLEIFKKEKGL